MAFSRHVYLSAIAARYLDRPRSPAMRVRGRTESRGAAGPKQQSHCAGISFRLLLAMPRMHRTHLLCRGRTYVAGAAERRRNCFDAWSISCWNDSSHCG